MFQNKYLWIIVLAFLTASCTTTPSDNPEESSNTEERVFLSNTQISNSGIELGAAEIREISNPVSARGRVILPPESGAILSALYPGRIKKIFIMSGEFVEKGDDLFSIENPDIIDIQADYSTAWYQYKNLYNELEAKKELLQDKVVSKAEINNLKNRVLALKVQIAAFEKRLRQLHITPENVLKGEVSDVHHVQAPISGIVNMNSLFPGDYIEQGSPVLEIMDTRKVIIELRVFEKDIHFVRPGQTVLFRPGSSMEGEAYKGKISTIGARVDENDRTVKVLVSVDDQTLNLLPGMFVSANVLSGEEKALSLPESAIFRQKGLETVFYSLPAWKTEEGRWFRSVAVDVGKAENNFVAIKFMQEPPDQALFALTGGYYIKSAYLLNEE